MDDKPAPSQASQAPMSTRSAVNEAGAQEMDRIKASILALAATTPDGFTMAQMLAASDLNNTHHAHNLAKVAARRVGLVSTRSRDRTTLWRLPAARSGAPTEVDTTHRPNWLPPRRIGLVPASSVFLERLLQLPAGSVITGMHWDAHLQQCVFAVSGPTMPLCELGAHIPQVRPLVRLDLDQGTAEVIEWPNHSAG